ncbi:MAG TPA: hypothetical protein PK335_03560 [Draconibacterium sp.]|nr:hypothetical protein [Draconibacterium sp.]
MSTKSLVLVFVLTCIPGIIYCDTEGDNLSEKLDNLENLIFKAELETCFCQQHSSWHFPCQLYNYVNLARQYGDRLNKGRNSRKFNENLQNLLNEVDECIQEKNNCMGNWNDVWGNPSPSIPDCALDAFEKMRNELETQVLSLNSFSN